MSIEEFYRQAIEDLAQSTLIASLIVTAATLVPRIPARDTDMSCCQVCERVLCGSCGKCHGLNHLPARSGCPLAQEMSWVCASWFQAYRAVRDVQRRSEQWSDW